MAIQLTPEELQKMRQILLDEDPKEALDLVKILYKRVTESINKGMESHLGNV